MNSKIQQILNSESNLILGISLSAEAFISYGTQEELARFAERTVIFEKQDDFVRLINLLQRVLVHLLSDTLRSPSTGNDNNDKVSRVLKLIEVVLEKAKFRSPDLNKLYKITEYFKQNGLQDLFATIQAYVFGTEILEETLYESIRSLDANKLTKLLQGLQQYLPYLIAPGLSENNSRVETLLKLMKHVSGTLSEQSRLSAA